MQPRMVVLTSGADDLEPAPRFYWDTLGFPTWDIVGNERKTTRVGPGLHRSQRASGAMVHSAWSSAAWLA